MLDIEQLLPPGYRFRELWDAELINNNATLPSSIPGGHKLTLTGARKGTTTKGAHFDGSATSNLNLGALYNAGAKLWVSLRFKLDRDYDSSASAYQFLWSKWIDDNNRILLALENSLGKLLLFKIDGGVNAFSISSTQISWNANQSYHVIASISSAEGVRLIIDNGTPVTDADTSALPNEGDLVIGSQYDGEASGIKGVISDVVIGTDDLSVAEELNLYKGVPPSDAINSYLLDEGRGVTAYDRGSGANNGTLDSSCSWDFGATKLPVLSLDGINDYAAHTAYVVNISGDLSLIWAGKFGINYTGIASYLSLVEMIFDNDNLIYFHYYPNDYVNWQTKGNGTQKFIPGLVPSVGDYGILIGTLTRAGVSKFFWNGNLVGSETGTGVIEGLARVFIGKDHTVGIGFTADKPSLIGLVEGDVSSVAKQLSRRINKLKNFGLTI